MREQFQARMLRIHCSEADKWKDEPLYQAIVAKCMELGLSGATAFRGIEGFGTRARIYRSGGLSFSKDAPVMVSVIGTEDEIQRLIPHLDEMMEEGLVASSKVEAIRYSRVT